VSVIILVIVAASWFYAGYETGRRRGQRDVQALARWMLHHGIRRDS
jgi:hypothetical protein